jgi:hypothetical protein
MMLAIAFLVAGFTTLFSVFAKPLRAIFLEDCDTDEAMTRWIDEMSLKELLDLNRKMQVAGACLLFAGFLLARSVR